MGERTKVEWCDHTFNAWIGCTRVSAGCDNCYAENLAARRKWHDWDPETPRKVMSDGYWLQPPRWNRRAEAAGRPALVFCSSLADVFDPLGPADERDRLFDMIRATPHLIWQLLTKRPQQMLRLLPDDFSAENYPNVWLGITTEDQETYDRRWPVLASVDAAVRFISYEPAVGPLWPTRADGVLPDLYPDWVICGGESGSQARPMRHQWALDIWHYCSKNLVPFFFKQWGTYASNPLVTETYLDHDLAKQVDPPENGKGGALLAGRLHREFPAGIVRRPSIPVAAA